MNVFSTSFGLLALIIALGALSRCSGGLNWYTIPLAVVGLVLGLPS